MEKEKKNLEEMFTQLEETVGKLENNDISLEEAFSFYEKGVKLVKQCQEEIDTVEKKVLELKKDGTADEFS